MILPKHVSKGAPKGRLLSESEWRGLGVQQSRGWVHYAIHRCAETRAARRLLPAVIARACTQTPCCRARLSCAGRSRTSCSSAAHRARTRPRASCTASASTRPLARSPERRRGRQRSDPSAGIASCLVPCSSRPAPSRGLLSALGVRGCGSRGLGGHDGSWLASCPRGLRARRNRSSWT